MTPSRGVRTLTAELEAETERVRRFHDHNARHYDAEMAVFERLLVGRGREWVCARARGEVLEIGVGSGRNLPWYPDDVSLTGVDLSRELLALARQRAAKLGRKIDLRLGDAQGLGFPDESFDTVVCTLSLCAIPDPGRAVAEAQRVLRPNGRLVLLEHVRSPVGLMRNLQQRLEPTLVRVACDHLTREPLDDLATAGFEVEELARSKLGIIERVQARNAALESSRRAGERAVSM